jgi:hypothetical protein
MPRSKTQNARSKPRQKIKSQPAFKTARVTIRLDEITWRELKKMAAMRGLPLAEMTRDWMLERFSEERLGSSSQRAAIRSMDLLYRQLHSIMKQLSADIADDDE